MASSWGSWASTGVGDEDEDPFGGSQTYKPVAGYGSKAGAHAARPALGPATGQSLAATLPSIKPAFGSFPSTGLLGNVSLWAAGPSTTSKPAVAAPPPAPPAPAEEPPQPAKGGRKPAAKASSNATSQVATSTVSSKAAHTAAGGGSGAPVFTAASSCLSKPAAAMADDDDDRTPAASSSSEDDEDADTRTPTRERVVAPSSRPALLPQGLGTTAAATMLGRGFGMSALQASLGRFAFPSTGGASSYAGLSLLTAATPRGPSAAASAVATVAAQASAGKGGGVSALLATPSGPVKRHRGPALKQAIKASLAAKLAAAADDDSSSEEEEKEEKEEETVVAASAAGAADATTAPAAAIEPLPPVAAAFVPALTVVPAVGTSHPPDVPSAPPSLMRDDGGEGDNSDMPMLVGTTEAVATDVRRTTPVAPLQHAAARSSRRNALPAAPAPPAATGLDATRRRMTMAGALLGAKMPASGSRTLTGLGKLAVPAAAGVMSTVALARRPPVPTQAPAPSRTASAPAAAAPVATQTAQKIVPGLRAASASARAKAAAVPLPPVPEAPPASPPPKVATASADAMQVLSPVTAALQASAVINASEAAPVTETTDAEVVIVLDSPPSKLARFGTGGGARSAAAAAAAAAAVAAARGKPAGLVTAAGGAKKTAPTSVPAAGPAAAPANAAPARRQMVVAGGGASRRGSSATSAAPATASAPVVAVASAVEEVAALTAAVVLEDATTPAEPAAESASASAPPDAVPEEAAPQPMSAALQKLLVDCVGAFLPVQELLACFAPVSKACHQAATSRVAWTTAAALDNKPVPGGATSARPVDALGLVGAGARAAVAAALQQAAAAATKAAVAAAAKRSTRGGGGAAPVAAAGAASPPLPAFLDTPPPVPIYTSWEPFLRAFPWGRFLAEGAYKRVYQVYCAARRRFEAVSVMDVAAIAATGNLPVIRAEIQVGCLLSDLVASRTCPNFVQIHAIFLHALSPGGHFPWLWGSPEDKAPQPLPSLEGSGSSGDSGGVDVTALQQKPLPPPPSVALLPPGKEDTFLARASRGKKKTQQQAAGSGSGSSTPRYPLPTSLHQYIRMELCEGGDIESYLRGVEPLMEAAEATAAAKMAAAAAAAEAAAVQAKQAPAKRGKGSKAAPAPVAPAPAATAAAEAALAAATLAALDAQASHFALVSLFQAVVSLYAARRELSLRHYDVKLLNCMLKPAGPDASTLVYGLGDETWYALPLPAPPTAGADAPLVPCFFPGHGHIVKLGDLGTAATGREGLGSPLRPHHLTTLENAAPEVFLLGDAVTESYGLDTWALGLCALHLLTGAAPYEEVLATVRCPQPLAEALHAVWFADDDSSPTFDALATVLDGDEDNCGADTLYRLLVVTGWGDEGEGWGFSSLASATDAYSASPLWWVLEALAGRSSTASSRLPASVVASFEADKASYSLARGSAPLMVRARRRLTGHLPGYSSALATLLALEPSRRPSMGTLLFRGGSASPFASLRLASSAEAAALGATLGVAVFDGFTRAEAAADAAGSKGREADPFEP